jgi:excinuclease ABC A subunit
VARHTNIQGKHIGELGELPIGELRGFLEQAVADGALSSQHTGLVAAITQRLQHLVDVGLGYLSLARTTPTLSGGELQRMFLAAYLISSLEAVIYVFDEPTIGMHEAEKELLLNKLRQLVDTGNTVIVVEHDPHLIAAADHIVDLGPGAGAAGGSLLYQGDYANYLGCEKSISATYLAGRSNLPTRKGRLDHTPFPVDRALTLHNVRTHNLQDITVQIPLGVLVGVAGVSGSGKSSLVSDSLVPTLLAGLGERDEDDDAEEFFSSARVGAVEGMAHIGRCAVISQKPIGRLSTSTPASFIGIYDRIRRHFAETPLAREKGLTPGHFTVNADGGCKKCDGKGKLWTHIGSGNFVSRVCEACNGTGFLPEVLEVRYQGRTICEILETTVSDALAIFQNDAQIQRMLSVLERIGMGYIALGQPSTTISGGEAQRIKLAKELGKRSPRKTLYILDEPTTGLSLADTANLLHVLDELVERGNTVLITEHDPAALSFCDYLIELGPGGGNQGGQIIATGTPTQLRADPASRIGRYL